MPNLVDFCIYTQFDPPFVKLPNLSKSIVKPLENNLSFFPKKNRMSNSIAKSLELLLVQEKNFLDVISNALEEYRDKF